MRIFLSSLIVIAMLTACGDDQSREGDKLFNDGQYEAAIEQYTEFLEYNPEDLKSIYNQGRAYEELGQFDKSLENYQKAIEIDPKHANALMSIGKYHFRNENFGDASFYFSKAAEIKKSDPQAFYLAGRSFHKVGQTTKALEAYNQAISQNSDYGEAYLYRGALKVYQGNKRSGCADIRNAQSLNVPDAEDAIQEYCN